MGQKHEQTNLASEFYVLSTLFRKGLDAHLTLGNKKSVDIVVLKQTRIFTIDVKGLAGKTNWLLGKKKPHATKNHIYFFISFLNGIKKINVLPELFIVKSNEVSKLAIETKKGFIIRYATLKKGNYQNWKLLS